jgi:hypothetical protein
VKTNSKNLSFEVLLDKLLALAQKEVPKQVLSNIAKAVAALSLAADGKQRDATVARFIKDLSKAKTETVLILNIYIVC